MTRDRAVLSGFLAAAFLLAAPSVAVPAAQAAELRAQASIALRGAAGGEQGDLQ